MKSTSLALGLYFYSLQQSLDESHDDEDLQ